MARGDVLVVEDTPEYTQVVTAALSNVGFTVRAAGTVADALQALDLVAADLVVLDLGLPDGDGFDVCRVVRERSNAYILILTVRAEEVDMLLGFRLGADDYMTKPFSTRELVARVEAMMRRPRGDLAGAIVRRFGDLTIDLTGSHPQVIGFINSSYPNMRSAVAMAPRPPASRTRRAKAMSSSRSSRTIA